MRRSSSPTLTKTNGASSCPVFDPANVAGSPFAFLMVAVFAIVSPVRHARRFLSRRSIKVGLPLNNDRCCDQQEKRSAIGSSTDGTSHSRKSNLGVSGIDRLLG
jgi:hypothetical protein